MPFTYPTEDLQPIWDKYRQPIVDWTSDAISGIYQNPADAKDDVNRIAGLLGFPEKSGEAFMGGLLGLTPGYIASNYRSPEQIQQLRRLMAEENRARGNINQVKITEPGYAADFYHKEIDPIYSSEHGSYEFPSWYYPMSASIRADAVDRGLNSRIVTDPIDQILRGSWYHGMRQEARDKVLGMAMDQGLPAKLQSTDRLRLANETGFPISLHGSQSISNKLGEPAGVSLSMLPTKAAQFGDKTDSLIHRVQPQYGGPPTQRVVNLMTPEGRGVLNDAYDNVVNNWLWDYKLGYNPAGRGMSNLGQHVANAAHEGFEIPEALELSLSARTGQFNKDLSSQLQSSGYRGLLYNPQRWNEYEMLMLDPKYVLPLDYRQMSEFANPAWSRKIKGVSVYDTPSGIDIASATPGVRKGLYQIGDLMSQNKSNLGDIYSERPWTQRLSNENKRRLLELIDPEYRETVGNQLYQP